MDQQQLNTISARFRAMVESLAKDDGIPAVGGAVFYLGTVAEDGKTTTYDTTQAAFVATIDQRHMLNFTKCMNNTLVGLVQNATMPPPANQMVH